MAEFTKEKLIAHTKKEIREWNSAIDVFGKDDEQALMEVAVYEIALAALTAGMGKEPVAYIDPFTFKNFATYRAGETDNKRMGREWVWANPDAGLIPLYAAPQLPQPAVDQKAVESLATDLMKRIDKITGERHNVATLSSLRVSIVEACRAAMLQGAEPVSQPCTLREGLAAIRELGTIDAGKIQAERDALNEPVQGWIPCSERMPEEIGRYWCYVEEQNSLGKSHYQWNCSWNGELWGGEMMYGRVTHWMPLQNPPIQPPES